MTPPISIVIVNWNGGPYLTSAIKSILNQSYSSFECILVDNASIDGSIEAAAKEFNQDPRFHLIRNEDNFGYCGGSNIGIRAASGELIVTMNPDVVLEPDFLSHVQEAFKNPSIGIIAPCLTRELDPEIIDSAGTIGFSHIFATAFRAGLKVEKNEVACEVFGAIGACAIYRTAMLNELADINANGEKEFFDDDFFTYYDEHDLQIRARWLGWKALYNPIFRAQHVWRHSVKSGLIKHRELYDKAFRNYYLSMFKNMPLYIFLRSIPSILMQECGIIALSLVYRYPIFFTSKFSALTKLHLMLPKRRKIIKTKRISSSEFFAGLSGAFPFFKFLCGVMFSECGDGKLLTFGKSSSPNSNNSIN